MKPNCICQWAIFVTLLPLVATADELGSLGSAARETQQAESIVRLLLQQKDLSLFQVIAAMKSTDAIGKNYYLGVAQVIADRNPQQSVDQCKKIISQLDQDSIGRYWAFTYVTNYEPELREKLLAGMLEDPCPELRYEAIENQLTKMDAATDSNPPSSEGKLDALTKLLFASRLPEQIEKIAKKLDESGKKVDLLNHFGFLPQWQTLGPFDNVNQAGFEIAFAPETDYLAGKLTTGKLSELKYEGKQGTVSWTAASTDKPDGKVDLNEPYSKGKGAIVYALGNFKATRGGPAQLRIGSPNAVKVWFNGKLADSREVYHTGGQIDQYVTPIDLQPGDNSIFVKVCQNEQTEPWAQDWYFQVRITDSTGLAIQPESVSK